MSGGEKALLADVEAFVRAEAEERTFGSGGQLYVSVAGEPVLDLAVGVDAVGAPVTPDTLFAVYCAAKPAVALATAALVGDGEVSFDDRLGDVLDADALAGLPEGSAAAGAVRALPAHLAHLRVSDLLDHTAGLHRLDGFTYVLAPAGMRPALALGTRPPDTWRPGDVAYSEVAAWFVLGLVVEALSGETVAGYVRRRVLGPVGAGDDLFVAGMTADEYARTRPRLGVNAHLDGPAVDPMLAERTRRLRTLPSPAFGNTASARGLGRLYEAVLAALRAPAAGPLAGFAPPDVLAALVTPHSHGHDPVMDRACGYGLGFMVGLRDHQYGDRVGPRAFGHSGFGGMTAGLADPDRDLVVVSHVNGKVDAASALGYRRPRLFDLVHRAVDALS